MVYELERQAALALERFEAADEAYIAVTSAQWGTDLQIVDPHLLTSDMGLRAPQAWAATLVVDSDRWSHA